MLGDACFDVVSIGLGKCEQNSQRWRSLPCYIDTMIAVDC